MAIRLLVLTSTLSPPPGVLLKGRKALIGRAVESDVRLPDPSVSALHATIRKRGENYILIDEHSTHGTGVSSNASGSEPVWLAPESPRVLEEGEHIWIGEIELQVQFEAAKRGAPTGREELAYQLVRAGLDAAGLECTDQLVADTLRQLTEMPDEALGNQGPPEPLPDPVGVAALQEEDRHPPWITDTFVSLFALLILALGAYGLYWLSGAG